jgi:imidazolonepropionase-like amidohydrolase
VFIGARDAWRMADELAAAGVQVVYKAVHVLPRDPVEGYDIHFRAPAVLAAAGVKLALGLGPRFSESMARNLPYEAAQALAYGLPPAAALRAVTLGPAEALGLADRLGSIAVGKDATLIAVDGDILDLRANVKRMWIAGEEVSLESRHTRLHEKYRNRPAR